MRSSIPEFFSDCGNRVAANRAAREIYRSNWRLRQGEAGPRSAHARTRRCSGLGRRARGRNNGSIGRLGKRGLAPSDVSSHATESEGKSRLGGCTSGDAWTLPLGRSILGPQDRARARGDCRSQGGGSNSTSDGRGRSAGSRSPRILNIRPPPRRARCRRLATIPPFVAVVGSSTQLRGTDAPASAPGPLTGWRSGQGGSPGNCTHPSGCPRCETPTGSPRLPLASSRPGAPDPSPWARHAGQS